MESEEKDIVVGLIDKATNSTAPEVDPRCLKAIKSVVRYSDSQLRIAAQTLMSLMKRDHSQVRYLALLIIDELFMRSKLFRTLLVENLDKLLSLSVGFRRDHPLPAPESVASVLRKKAIEFLEKWNDSFGIQYRQLRLGYDYLKNTLRYQFPNVRLNADRIREERMKRDMKTKEILLKKFEHLKANFPTMKREVLQTIEQIGEGLDILRTEDEDMSFTLDDAEMEEFRNTELRQIRIDSLKEGEKVQENGDNEVVFDALRELYKVLFTKHLPTIQEWLSTLVRVEVEDSRFRDSVLKDIIDLKNVINLTKTKCEESGCDFSKTTAAEEEDIWEDGTIMETSGELKSSQRSSKSNHQPPTSVCNKVRNPRSQNSSSTGNAIISGNSSGSDSDPLRSMLLTEAPVLNWGSYLDNWGSNSEALANQRGLDLESHWGRVDLDAVIPSKKIAELNMRASVYKEEPIEIPLCRAPLRSGGLCQRRDLRSCPFHGPIVQRNDEGKPIEESPEANRAGSQQEESTLDVKEDELANQLFKQTVNNVRGRDMEAAKKKVLDQRALKKAKYMKVREHNEACLRDAALTTMWRSEATEAGSSSRPSKGKKETLASMLKKKETPKHRIEQRLRSGRPRNSTVAQLAVAQDANYREAFPNQW